MEKVLNCFACSEVIASSDVSYNDFGLSHYDLFENLSLRYCNNCGFGFAVPELSEESLNLFYENQYRDKSSTFYIDFSKKPKNYPKIRRSRNFSQIILGRVFCDFKKGDHFLNIGTGDGGSFRVAKAILKNPSLHSIEKSEGAKDYYSKYYGATSHEKLSAFSKDKRKAKMLLMSHTLEHFRLSDLDVLFAEITSALDDNGVIVIEVPHVDLRIHQNIRGADTPHLLFFNIESMEHLLNKYNFQILFIDTCDQEYTSVPINSPKMSGPVFAKVKSFLRTVFNHSPKWLKGFVRSAARMTYAPRTFLFTRLNEKVLGKLPQHTYGGNRICLRVVAQKKSF